MAKNKTKIKNKSNSKKREKEKEEQQQGNLYQTSPMHSSRSITKNLLKETQDTKNDWTKESVDLNFNRSKRKNNQWLKDGNTSG